MSNYDFSTLNDKEFEQLSKDLLNAKFNMGLQDFKVGKDKGIDLRYSTPANNNSIVVQVKQYIGSGYAQLKHSLSKIEFPKIKLLAPDRYIVVTSMSLTATQKDELKTDLAPFVQTSNDIIGKEDLNGYISEHDEIEKKYFKLWFSSITVFEAVLHNAIEGRTRYMLEKIRIKIPYYVLTKNLSHANDILQKEKLLLITGQPGIGKTTLAEIMLFDRARNGYKIYKVENISEAEQVISVDKAEKQLFYFDDFLGANYFEIVNAHKTETQLTNFVERVKNTPNKYLILTTRTVILNHALGKYEKISRSTIASQRFEIKLTDYNKYEKALILYNHLYFKGVKSDYYQSIVDEKFYRKIIHHENYTPRIIDFITDSVRFEKLTTEMFLQFILNNLNNPREIWRYSYNNQIDYLDRCLLLTLFTFENGCFEPELIEAFNSRLFYEKSEHNQVIVTNQFHLSAEILLNGFILAVLHEGKQPIREYNFINPSLTDFMIGQLAESLPDRKNILSALCFSSQLDRFDPEKSLVLIEKDLQIIIRDRLASGQIKIKTGTTKQFTENKKNAINLALFTKYCKITDIDELLLNHFRLLTFDEGWLSILEEIEFTMLNLDRSRSPLTFEFIKQNFLLIIEKMMDHTNDFDSAIKVPELFKQYDHNYDAYIKTEMGLKIIIGMMDLVLHSKETDFVDDKKDEYLDIADVSEIYDEIESMESMLKDELTSGIDFRHDFGMGMDEDYWERKIGENLDASRMNDSLAEDYDGDHYHENRFTRSNEDKAIDDLFTRPEGL